MRILYASDMHGNFDKLETFCQHAEQSKPDLIVLAGDLSDVAYKDQGLIQQHMELSEILFQYALQYEPGMKRLKPHEFRRVLPIVAEKIYEKPMNKSLEQLAEKYLKILDFFDGNMNIRYDLIGSMMKKHGLEFKTYPGNHDKDLQRTSLKDSNAHKRTLNLDGLLISFFGSANEIRYGDIVLMGTPAELTMPFAEYLNQEGKLVSEVFNFLNKEKPDVAFTHAPPKGCRDFMIHPKTKQPVSKGSPGLERYVHQGDTRLLCCGHMHESVGAEKIDSEKGPVVVFNAGSLSDGFFGELVIDEGSKKMDKVSLYKIKNRLILPPGMTGSADGGEACKIITYFLTPENELKKMKIDLEEKYDY